MTPQSAIRFRLRFVPVSWDNARSLARLKCWCRTEEELQRLVSDFLIVAKTLRNGHVLNIAINVGDARHGLVSIFDQHTESEITGLVGDAWREAKRLLRLEGQLP